MNSRPLDLSIVILRLMKNASAESHRAIGSYLSARPLQAEILVVDDGSSDATPKMIESYRGKYPDCA